MRFQCPFCRGIVAVDNSDLGIDVQCGHCGGEITVPNSRVATGAVIADFIILEELGRGGMGVVYLAHQISLDRPAALKVLAESYANDAEFVVGFIKEARSAAKLNHPHIVQAYAVGEDEGIFYFAMENIEGRTMKEVLKEKGIIPPDEAISIIQQIAEALGYAWKEQRLIHRDIKPDNIMLTKNNRAKLADLGLSRVAGEIDDSEEDEVMGTPQYISPEHLTGAPMDIRSDIYSLGATFYHLATGKFPFEGKTATDIARKHLEEELVPPHLVNTKIPEGVSQVIVKMMRKNVKERYQDADALVDDLRMVKRGKPPPTATEGIKKPKSSSQKKMTKSSKGSKMTLTKKKAHESEHSLTSTGMRRTSRALEDSIISSGTYIGQNQGGAGKKIFIVIIILLILGGGGFAFWQYFLKDRMPSRTRPATGAKPKPGPSAKPVGKASDSALVRKVNEIMDFRLKNPRKEDEFMEMTSKFMEEFPKPEEGLQKEKYQHLMEIFVPIDERRIQKARQAAHEKHQKFLDLRRKEDMERSEKERERRKAERLRQQRQRQREQREKERLERLAKRQAEYKTRLENEKNYMRHKFVDYVKKDEYKKALEIFEPALKEPERAEKLSDKEKENAREFAEWATRMRTCIQKSAEIDSLLTNSGTKLEGKQVEPRPGYLGKIVKIENRILTVKSLLSGKTMEFPVNTIKPKFFIRLLKKISEETGDNNAYFYYLFSNGIFYGLQKAAPDEKWQQEVSDTAFEYFKYKLKSATGQEKLMLRRKYGRLPDFRRAMEALE